MPDFTMCHDEACPKRFTCKRSARSGTRPGNIQSWFRLSPRENDDSCPDYWHVERVTDVGGVVMEE